MRAMLLNCKIKPIYLQYIAEIDHKICLDPFDGERSYETVSEIFCLAAHNLPFRIVTLFFGMLSFLNPQVIVVSPREIVSG